MALGWDFNETHHILSLAYWGTCLGQPIRQRLVSREASGGLASMGFTPETTLDTPSPFHNPLPLSTVGFIITPSCVYMIHPLELNGKKRGNRRRRLKKFGGRFERDMVSFDITRKAKLVNENLALKSVCPILCHDRPFCHCFCKMVSPNSVVVPPQTMDWSAETLPGDST